MILDILQREGIKLTGFSERNLSDLIQVMSESEKQKLIDDVQKEIDRNRELSEAIKITLKYGIQAIKLGIDLAL